jgi:hypothetical protein
MYEDILQLLNARDVLISLVHSVASLLAGSKSKHVRVRTMAVENTVVRCQMVTHKCLLSIGFSSER